MSKSSLLNGLSYMGNPANQLRGDALGSALTGGNVLARNVQPLAVADVRTAEISNIGNTQAFAPGTSSNIMTADLTGNPPTQDMPNVPTPVVVATNSAPSTIDLVNNTPNATTQPAPPTPGTPQLINSVPVIPEETLQVGIFGDPHYQVDGQTFTHVGVPGNTYQLLQTEDVQLNVLYMKTDWDISVIAAARIVTADHTIDYSLRDNSRVMIDGKIVSVDSLPGGRVDLGNGNFLTGGDGTITINVASENGGPPAQIKVDMTDTRAGDVRITGELDTVSGIVPYLAEDVTVGNKTYNNRMEYLQSKGVNVSQVLEADLNKRFDVTATANGIPTSVFTKGLGK